MRKNKMLKMLSAFMVIALLLTMQGISVLAEPVQDTEESYEYVEFTEEDRYNPKYYEPLEPVYATQSTLLRTTGEDFETYVVNALKNWETEIDISQYGLSAEELKNYISRIIQNHAELFYIASGYRYSSTGADIIELLPEYEMEKEEAEEIQMKMDVAAEEALSLLSDGLEDYEKALIVHDWLAMYCQYDEENYNNGTVPKASHSAYGPLVNKIAVCDGYAKAYMYIMKNKLGIPCQVVVSDEMKHGWNMIQIGAQYYHVDVTWDDPTPDIIGRVTHDYFLLSDAKIENNEGHSNHSGWTSDYPAEDTTYENALWVKSNGNIVYRNGLWYYVDSDEQKLLKTTNILNGASTSLYEYGNWYYKANQSFWPGAYSSLMLYRNNLLFNGPKEIYSMPFATENVTVLYEPAEVSKNESTGELVYNMCGFKTVGDTMYYAVVGDMNDSKSQTVYTASVPGEQILGTIEISGTLRYGETLSANVTLSEGITGELSYQWYRNGRKITGAAQKSYQLTAEDIGTEISVEVIQLNYIGSLKESTGSKIQKAIPKTPVAITRQGEFGKKLSSVSLPEGYAWKEPDTVMDKAGETAYAVTYCPNTSLYETLNLTVSVTVTLENSEKLWISKDKTQLKAGETVELQLCFEKLALDTMACRIVYDTECFEELKEEDILSEEGAVTYNSQTGKLEIHCGNGGTVLDNSGICTIHLTAKKDIRETIISLEDIQAAYLNEDVLTSQRVSLRLAVSEDTHIWDAGQTTKDADCTQKGEKQYTCTVCGETKTEEIPAAGHGHTEVRNQKEATCKEAGYSGDTYCIDCGALIQEGETVPSAGKHSWDAGEVIKEPGCNKKGEKQYTCTACGTTRTEELAATGHQHFTVRGGYAPTCIQMGYMGDAYCADCGVYIMPGELIPPAGHNWKLAKTVRKSTAVKAGVAKYICTGCGAEKMEALPIKDSLKKGTTFIYQKLQYKVTKSGKKDAQVKVTGIDKKLSNVVIPDTVEVDGIYYKVTGIDAKAFLNDKKLKTVTIGKNVKTIGEKAFYGCKKLKRITLKTKVLTAVGKKAFNGTAKNAVIQCPKKCIKKYKKLGLSCRT